MKVEQYISIQRAQRAAGMKEIGEDLKLLGLMFTEQYTLDEVCESIDCLEGETIDFLHRLIHVIECNR